MVTTIQIKENTLLLLKKLKEQMNVGSYEEVIKKIVIERASKESLAGFLGKRYGRVSKKNVLKDLRDKDDRF